MLKNFVTDEDLKKFYPLISETLWSNQADYSTQIEKASLILSNDLYNRGLNPRLCMVPLDLNYVSGQNQPLAAVTKTGTFTGSAYKSVNESRFVVKASAITGTFAFKLQGSNLTTEPAAGDSSWEDVPGASFLVTDTRTATVAFHDRYRYYRHVITTAGTTITYTAACYETSFDDLIAHRALAMIFNDWAQANPQYRDYFTTEMALYDSALSAARFAYDSDDDGVAETTDEQRSSSVRVTR